MPTDRWMDKELTHAQNQIQLSHEKTYEMMLFAVTYGLVHNFSRWSNSEKERYNMILLVGGIG